MRVAITLALCSAALVLATSASAPTSDTALVPVLIGLRHSPDALDRLFDTLARVSDIHDAHYGHHLSRDALRDLIAPALPQRVRVTRWLLEHGGVRSLSAPDVETSDSGDFLRARVPASAVDALLASWRANDDDIAADVDSVVPLVADVHAPLHQAGAQAGHMKQRFALKAYRNVAARSPTAGDQTGDPNTQKQSYGIPTTLVTNSTSGQTQMVWGTGTYGFLPSDLQQFYSDWGLPPSNAANLFAAGGFAGTPGGDNFGEATLDVTYISSLALGVPTYVSNTDNATNTEWSYGFGTAMYAFFTSLADAASVPTVLSLSLGSLSYDSCSLLCTLTPTYSNGAYTTQQCTDYMVTQRQVCMYPDSSQIDRMNVEFAKLGVRGVSILAASGDGGSHFSFQEFPGIGIGAVLNDISCALNLPTFPADSPYVTAVGGTQWSVSPSQPIAWTASGGGFSWRFPMPSYQKQVVQAYLAKAGSGLPAANSYNATNRAYPDVAALANGVPMCVQGQETEAGGTSASAPTFAGIVALLNDARFAQGLRPLGFLNPRLYITAALHPGELFYDMSVGNSNCGADGFCCSTGFPAAVGFDPTTGLGSPLWAGLQKYLTHDS